MGRHDKQDVITLRARVDAAEWLRERNHTLAKENTQLREQIKKLQNAALKEALVRASLREV